MAKPGTGTERAERAKLAFSNYKQRQDALLEGLQQQAQDISDVVDEMLSEGYTTEKWMKDMTALWINGAAIWPNALIGATPLVPDRNKDDDEKG